MDKRERKARRRQRLIERWQASGESAERFARRAGVSVATLWYWKRRCREEKGPPGLVPVQLIGEGAGSEALLELLLGNGRRLLIRGEVPMPALVNVLRALATC
jgi:transposase-like protein